MDFGSLLLEDGTGNLFLEDGTSLLLQGDQYENEREWAPPCLSTTSILNASTLPFPDSCPSRNSYPTKLEWR